MLSMIAAIGKNRELGEKNKLLWHLPGDLARFREITKGHPVIMGRKTFESIGHALPGRVNIVISRDRSFKAEGVMVVSSLNEALLRAKEAPGSAETFVIGGGQIYTAAINEADRLYLTIIDKEAPGADTFFPPYTTRFTRIIEKTPHEENGIRFTYLTLEREE
jgi:dihydrofolate reductase